MTINHDRHVADLETVYDPVNGVFNSLFATATPLFYAADDGSGYSVVRMKHSGLRFFEPDGATGGSDAFVGTDKINNDVQ